jgi:hypothetical protein
MRDPTANTDIAEKKREAAIEEARERLRPLTTMRSWSIVNWDQAGSERRKSRRELHDAAVEFLIALLDPAKPKNSAQAETYDNRTQRAADELLGVHASIVRKVVLPALRLPPPPKRKGRRAPKRKGPPGTLLRNRLIAAVVTIICKKYDLDPYRNPESKHTHNGCAVVAEALKRLGIGLSESSVRQICAKHG